MIIRTLALAAITAVVAGTAGAQAISPGDVQLALKAGVQPGAYSTADLIRLLDLQRENRTGQINYVLQGTNDVATRMSVSMPAKDATASFASGIHSDNY